MSGNPAKVGGRSRFKQGLYKPANPQKYVGDVNKIVFRSSWELKVCQKLDYAEYVVAWCMEHPVIHYTKPTTGRVHRYFPDFLVKTKLADGSTITTLIEVKPDKERFPPKPQGKKKSRYLQEAVTYEVNTAKWNAARAYCKQKGWNFVVLTEKEILGV